MRPKTVREREWEYNFHFCKHKNAEVRTKDEIIQTPAGRKEFCPILCLDKAEDCPPKCLMVLPDLESPYPYKL